MSDNLKILSKYNQDNEIVTVASDPEYYYNRFHIIAGSYHLSEVTALMLLTQKDGSEILSNVTVELNKGFIKAIEEMVSNTTDIFSKTDGQYGNKIKIIINRDKGHIEFTENGSGIGIPPNKIESAITNFKTSSNYEWKKDDTNYERSGNGVNGFGWKLVSLSSEELIVTSVNLDGQRAILTCRNNLKDINLKVDKATPGVTKLKAGISAIYKPDLELFGFKSIDEALTDNFIGHLKALLINLSVTFPDMSIDFSVIEKKEK